ncbi:general substrate transporter [Aspergillus fruticulosus]
MVGSESGRWRRIPNPLGQRPPNVILGHATNFYNTYLGPVKDDRDVLLRGPVVDNDVFLRGVRLALDQDDDPIPSPESQKYFGTFDLFQETKDLKVTILVTACAAITQGWQQSTINASSRYWREQLLPGSLEHNELMAGLIDAAPWLSGSLIGTWLSDPLQEGILGRRRALFISAVFCTVFPIATARSESWEELLAFRLLLGIGIGAKASIAPVFAAETAVDHLRGRLLMMWQLFDAFGIFLGFVCVWIVDQQWRVLLGTAAIPSLILLFLVFLCPESPRFLMRKKRYREAFLSLRHLRGSDIQACRDLYYIHSQLQYESQKRLALKPGSGFTSEGAQWLDARLLNYQDVELSQMNFFKRALALWTNERNRRACIAAFIVMASQQLCGVNVLAFYSSHLFERVTDDETDDGTNSNWPTKVAWMNIGFGLANFLFTIPAYWFIDMSRHRGRRILLLVSLGGIFFTIIAIGSFFFIADDHARLGLVSFFTIIIFLFFYGIGAGPVPFTFSAEVFPLAFREVGMSFSVMVNFLGLGLLVLLVPFITSEFGLYGNSYLLYLFGGLDLLAFALVFLFVPSTGRIPLENMDHSTRRHPNKSRNICEFFELIG